MNKLIAICFAVVFFAVVATAEEKIAEKAAAPASPGHAAFAPADIQWQDAPPMIPPGAKMAVLKGDPTKEGIFVMRISVPADYKLMPHWHPAYEHVTVLSGEVHIGMGDKFHKTKAQAVPAGGFFYTAPMMNHYAWCPTETVIQLEGMGPWQLYYVNPKDDPSKKKK